jgi:hypothetical protein
MARYLKGFNLLERQDLALFCSICVRIESRVQQYYADVLTALTAISTIRTRMSRNIRTPTASSAVRTCPSTSPQKSKTDPGNSLEGKSTQFMDFSNRDDEMMDRLTAMNEGNEGEMHKLNDSLSWLLYWLNRLNSELPGTFPQVPPFRRWFVDRQPRCNQSIRIKLPYIDITAYAKGVGEMVEEEEDDSGEDDSGDEGLRLEDRVREMALV